jgi:hypothetical protein
MRFRAPSAHQATGSDLHRDCLTRLCCAYRLSQPPDALFLPRPFQLCFTLVAPLGFALQRFVPPAKPAWPSDHALPSWRCPVDETARRILFDLHRLPGWGLAGHPRVATNPFADWRLVRSGPPLVRPCPVLPPLPRKGISPARTLRRPGKASVGAKTTLVVAAMSPKHHCWCPGSFAATPAQKLRTRETSTLGPGGFPAPKSGPSSGSSRRPPRSRPDAPRATLQACRGRSDIPSCRLGRLRQRPGLQHRDGAAGFRWTDHASRCRDTQTVRPGLLPRLCPSSLSSATRRCAGDLWVPGSRRSSCSASATRRWLWHRPSPDRLDSPSGV